MGAPLGNVNRARIGLVHVLTVANERDDYTRLRKGVNKLLDRFSKEGGIREAEFIRDTLDGKPNQRIEMNGDSNQALTSLSVLFVEAAQRLADQRQGLTIEQKGSHEVVGGDGREPER